MGQTKPGTTIVVDHFLDRTKLVTLRTDYGTDYPIQIERERQAWLDAAETQLQESSTDPVPATETDPGFDPDLSTRVSELLSKGAGRDISASAQAVMDATLGPGAVSVPAGITLQMVAGIIVAGIEEIASDNEAVRMLRAQLDAQTIDQATYDAAVADKIEVQ